MRIGKLRFKVVLQEKGTVTRDALGAEVVAWNDLATAWAEADPWHLRERLQFRRQQGESVIGLRVRTPFAASLGKRILFEGSYYNITELDATRKGELMIVGRAEDTAP